MSQDTPQQVHAVRLHLAPVDTPNSNHRIITLSSMPVLTLRMKSSQQYFLNAAPCDNIPTSIALWITHEPASYALVSMMLYVAQSCCKQHSWYQVNANNLLVQRIF